MARTAAQVALGLETTLAVDMKSTMLATMRLSLLLRIGLAV